MTTMSQILTLIPSVSMRMLLLLAVSLMAIAMGGPSHGVTAETINIALVAPRNNPLISYTQALTAANLAVQHLSMGNPNLLHGHQISVSNLHYGESWESTLSATLNNGHVDAIIGLTDDLTTPASVLAQGWNVPLISMGIDNWNYVDRRDEFPTLTLAGPVNHASLAKMLASVARHHGWNKIKLIYQDREHVTSAPAYCDAMPVVGSLLEGRGLDVQTVVAAEAGISPDCLEGAYSVIVLCGSHTSVRDLMIDAKHLDYANGDYVFFNIDLFSSNLRPWYVSTDSDERNTAAAEAYDAVQTISLRMPTSQQYRQFSYEVKRRVMNLRPGVYDAREVNLFVGGFHDALMLYALALNESLNEGRPVTDGRSIAGNMRGRTFQGITGTFAMDGNGTHLTDLSLRSMNPQTRSYQVAANFYGNRQMLEPVVGRQPFWAGERVEPPPDTPPRERWGSPPDGGPSGGPHGSAPSVHNIQHTVTFPVTIILLTLFPFFLK